VPAVYEGGREGGPIKSGNSVGREEVGGGRRQGDGGTALEPPVDYRGERTTEGGSEG